MPRWPLEARGAMAALRRARAGIIPASRPPVACNARPTPMVATTQPLIEPNAQTQYEIGPEDLPLSCPMPQTYLRNSHPRMYLAVQESGSAKCPYSADERTRKGL